LAAHQSNIPHLLAAAAEGTPPSHVLIPATIRRVNGSNTQKARSAERSAHPMLSPTDFGYGSFVFNWGDHICAIFDDHAQQMEVMAPYLSAGIQLGQRCVWTSSLPAADALRQSLHGMGGDVITLEASGQLLILSEPGFYLYQGIFEPERTMDLLRALLSDSQRQGYTAMRIANDVSWTGSERVDPELWQEFESRLTQEVAELPLCLVCQYDRRQVPGSILVVAMRTHPAVILGTTFRQNPFYEPAAAQGPRSREVM